ncbi:GUN4 domain-containing protein [Thalassoporum mexicanum PCC 7367]|uniref:toll/interleukin-1 receptor domain-containing protein n=1 Tax=Thalassoporum mexicanum TaxID=3457544 RepID=UPI00029FEF8D|nr:toll/interleukin-1 receptor domain-containing protein [Pseudanabaena sp. PCC 7367]AFY68343.1 GUN4 domain-containing protein [Pseudanabaena sp. PCC 7367]
MSPEYDAIVFYSADDRREVIEICEKLKEKGIKLWLDIWELRPGTDWQKELDNVFRFAKSAIVFVGASSVSPWQNLETRAFLRESTKTMMPIIPVILESAPKAPQLPAFLSYYSWVDFRSKSPDPIEQLMWGITGQKVT